MKLSCSAKKKHSPSDTSPEAGRGRPRGRLRGRPRGRSCGRSCGRPRGRCRGRPRSRQASRPSRHREANPPKPSKPSTPSKPSKPSKTLQTLQTPSPTGTPGPRPLPNQAPGPRPQQWLSIGFQSCRLPARKHSKRSKTIQTLQNPPNTIQNLQNPPCLEACFEQVAQGLWLVRRVHRRSKTISLPGRLELPTLRLTASRSNQPSYGSLCRRPKLVPVLEKRLNNSWLQMVCQTKGQQPK